MYQLPWEGPMYQLRREGAAMTNQPPTTRVEWQGAGARSYYEFRNNWS